MWRRALGVAANRAPSSAGSLWPWSAITISEVSYRGVRAPASDIAQTESARAPAEICGPAHTLRHRPVRPRPFRPTNTTFGPDVGQAL
jgi:hypothetical protein